MLSTEDLVLTTASHPDKTLQVKPYIFNGRRDILEEPLSQVIKHVFGLNLAILEALGP